MIRIGLVGVGDAGRHHARALVELASQGEPIQWAGVVARDPGRIARIEDELSHAHRVPVWGSLEELLAARSCDAVVLATPDGLHAEQALQCVERGLAVLVEKPLALSRADGERVIEAATRADVSVAVGHHLRHHAAHRLALTLLPSRVGALRHVSIRWAWPDPAREGWRATGHHARTWSLAALGTHGIDLALWSGGAPAPEDLRVAGLCSPSHGMDRAAEVAFTLGCGALAHVSVSVEHRAPSRVVWSGDRGELEARGTLGARGEGELEARTPRGEREPVPFEPQNPYAAQLRAFASKVAAGFVPDPAWLPNLAIIEHLAPEAT